MNDKKLNLSFDISLVILTWNSEKYISRCLKSYAASICRDNLCAEFLIVDNGSIDRTASIIENDLFPDLPTDSIGRLFRLNENLGTTRSRNIALKEANGKYIIICDSDTEFREGNWKDVFSYFENIDVGMIAPCLIFPDGSIQNSVKKFPTLRDKFLKLGKIFFNFSKGAQTDFYDDFPWKTSRVADTAISACWILKRALLEEVGLLDENIFYSPEDLDYCLRVWEKKKKIIYYPYLKIIHHTQQISHRKPFSRQSISHFWGLLYYFKKHKYFFSREKLKNCLRQGVKHE